MGKQEEYLDPCSPSLATLGSSALVPTALLAAVSQTYTPDCVIGSHHDLYDSCQSKRIPGEGYPIGSVRFRKGM